MLGSVEGVRERFGDRKRRDSTAGLPWPTIRIGEGCQYSAELAHRLAGLHHTVKPKFLDVASTPKGAGVEAALEIELLYDGLRQRMRTQTNDKHPVVVIER